jgi:hypothetical protein
MNAWSHLPNAAHIAWVLKDVKAHPKRWDAAWDAARGAAYGAAWDAARDAAYDAAGGVARASAWVSAWAAARDAVSALIAYDDCTCILDLAPGAVRLMASTGHHAAILLYPATLAKNFKEIPNALHT